MSYTEKYIRIEEICREVIKEVTEIPATDEVGGGTAITGFVHIEKLIHIKEPDAPGKIRFIEKMLPFSYMTFDISEEDKQKQKSDT